MMSWCPRCWGEWVLGVVGHINGGGRSLRGPPKAGRAGGLFWLTRRLTGQDERCARGEAWLWNLRAAWLRDSWAAWLETAGLFGPLRDIKSRSACPPTSLVPRPPTSRSAAPSTHHNAYAGTGCPRSRSRRATQALSPHSARAASPMQMTVAPGGGRAGGAQPRCARGNLKGAEGGRR